MAEILTSREELSDPSALGRVATGFSFNPMVETIGRVEELTLGGPGPMPEWVGSARQAKCTLDYHFRGLSPLDQRPD